MRPAFFSVGRAKSLLAVACHAGTEYVLAARRKPVATAVASAAVGAAMLGSGLLLTGAGASIAFYGSVGALASGLAAGLCVFGGCGGVARFWGKAMGGCLMVSVAGGAVSLAGSTLFLGGQITLAGAAVLGVYGVGKAVRARRHDAVFFVGSSDTPPVRNLLPAGNPLLVPVADRI